MEKHIFLHSIYNQEDQSYYPLLTSQSEATSIFCGAILDDGGSVVCGDKNKTTMLHSKVCI